MTATEQPASPGRVASIDVFRGLTILTMIFVNDAAGVRNIPWWMEHFSPEASGMTFVDLVFPAFLFIVGMSIPFAMTKRRQQGDTDLQLWKHILIRTAGLLTLGVFMVNFHGFSESITGINRTVWELLVFVAAFLVWNLYPASTPAQQTRARILRWAGIVGLVALAAVYRSGTAGQVEWMHTSWWGILGLIGWAYLTASAVYYFLGAQPAAIVGMMAFFIALFVGDASHAFDHALYYVKQVVAVGPHIGGHAMITTAGMVVSSLFFGDAKLMAPGRRITWMILFGSMLMIAGFCFVPLYGISKNAATPAWCLYSAAYCSWIFAALYWLVDVKQISKWARFVKPAGANPLLAYILPDIFYCLLSLFGIHILSQMFGDGLIGIARSLVVALAMVWLTVALNKLGVRLHL
jgi:heparan-alpha-glucosaminide N-acetyltransferase